MADFLPLFPLNLVAYPGEGLNLHVFEPRYRQLVGECIDAGSTFGIPAFIDNKIPGYGTEMRVTELAKRHDDGRLDVRTEGLRVFRIVTFQNPAPGKLYAGGKVSWQPDEPYDAIMPGLLERLRKLHRLLHVPSLFEADTDCFSYTVAHKIGLSVEEEYELLTLPRETERQAFLIRHLERILPVVAELERTKERIRMNGHFKNLDPIDF
ncbi:MAG: LON peptidase substrate-binding domain-containing protein [Cytophagaceae bacterium]|nr:LON peptidase substrate-binding domain-containing protein [Cytophagaceae bacterium]